MITHWIKKLWITNDGRGESMNFSSPFRTFNSGMRSGILSRMEFKENIKKTDIECAMELSVWRIQKSEKNYGTGRPGVILLSESVVVESSTDDVCERACVCVCVAVRVRR